jgi:hypothetical protein
VLFLGVLGSPYMGFKQDLDLDKRLNTTENAALYAQIKGAPKMGTFGESPSLDQDKIKALTPEQAKQLDVVQAANKRGVFAIVAILPTIMLAFYVLMWLYFKSKGGYKPIALGHGEEGEPGF